MIASALPAQPTTFIGRADEMAEIVRLLADPACRLLTLVGPGGIGKTRLALEVAGKLDFPDGAHFVSLQPLSAPDFIISAVGGAVDFQFYSGGNPLEQLTYYLRDKSLLLIVDNLEHLLDGVDVLSDLLADAPGLKVLATSREALNLQEEWLYSISGMAFPATADVPDREAYPAVRLFVQNARRLRPDFALEHEIVGVVRLCALVEGMPLALELAASWVRTLNCAEIADEITQSLDILETPVRNVPLRHRSMRAVLEQSWKLLSSAEQETFARLSVFRGGFNRAAAEAVAGASLRMLSTLVNKSLLRRDVDGRYDIHELLRQYGEEQLRAAPQNWIEAHDRHAACFAEFMGGQWFELRSARQQESVAVIEAEIENVRTAWLYAANEHKLTNLYQAANAMWSFHMLTFHEKDGLELFHRAVEAVRPIAADDESRRVLGKLLIHYGSLLDEKYEKEDAKAALDEGLVLLQACGSPEELVIGRNSLLHHYISRFGWLVPPDADPARWIEPDCLAQENLRMAREVGHAWLIAECQYALALLRFVQDDLTEARQIGEEALQVAERSGDAALIGAVAGSFLGRVLEKLGDYTRSKQMRLYSNRVLEQAGYWMPIGWNYQGLGYIAFLEKQYAEAQRAYQQSLRVYMNLYGHPHRYGQMSQALVNVGKLWAVQGRIHDAVALLIAVTINPRSTVEARIWAEEELTRFRAELVPEVYITASEHAKTLDIEAAAQAFINQPVDDQLANVLPDGLTAREVEILHLVAAGRSNREIAEALIFSVGTVKWYINQIYSKLGVGSRTQAVARARELHLLT